MAGEVREPGLRLNPVRHLLAQDVVGGFHFELRPLHLCRFALGLLLGGDQRGICEMQLNKPTDLQAVAGEPRVSAWRRPPH